MKNVFDNYMTCHVWAQQSQEEGRNSSSSIYFKGDTIFSYGAHFPMARFVKNDSGETCVLITTQNYSVTTQRHLSLVRSSIDTDKYRVFYVPYLTGMDLATTNINHFKILLNDCIYDAIESRATSSHWLGSSSGLFNAIRYLKQMKNILMEARLYCHFFGFDLNYKIEEKLKLDLIKSLARKKELKAKAIRDEPKKEERRIKRLAAKRREAIKDTRAFCSNWMKGLQADQYSNYRTLSEFNIPILLRVKGDNVETSLGATVNIKYIKAAWDQVKKCKLNRISWKPNGHKILLGHFTLDKINPDGSIKAGCHTIKYGPIKYLARMLNFI